MKEPKEAKVVKEAKAPSYQNFSNLGEIYAHPLGRDIVDKLILQLGAPSALVINPLTKRIPLPWLRKIAEKKAPGLFEALRKLLEMNPQRLADTNFSPAVSAPAWWKEAVFYQIYPRSFADANGDGIGDLRGIIGKLDYLENLGVDCLWLSPIFASPNEDMGYDVSDYRAVMDLMGSEEDLEELIREVHARGMRIILDLVLNHTSQEHAWFQEALTNPAGDKAAYYFFQDGSPDTPPNNWVSFFSGSAWRWMPEIKKWVLHLFAPGQLDLNWDNPAVRREAGEIAQFWLEKGVDGFRLDVINYISKAPQLPAGNPAVGDLVGFTGIEHYFAGPHLHEYLREFRRAVAAGKNGAQAVLIGETPGIGVEVGRLLSHQSRQELDLYFNFDVLEMPGKIRWDDYQYDPAYFLDFYLRYLPRLDAGDQLAIFSENHDNPRIVSKITSDPAQAPQVAKLIAAISLTLPGTPFIFQGQELGAVNQDFRGIEQLCDVESINYYAELQEAGMVPAVAWERILAGSRDHARVPMPWERNGGFTTGEAWLSLCDLPPAGSAAEQLAKPDSVFNFYRQLLQLRKDFAAADFSLLARSGAYAAWRRGDYFVEVNLAPHPIPRRKNVATAAGEVLLAAGKISKVKPGAGKESVLGKWRGKSGWLSPYAVVISRGKVS